MNVALRIVAGVIDLLQLLFFVVFLALQFATPIGGVAAGGITGAVACWNLSTGFWEGVTNATACLVGGGLAGGILSIIAVPTGVVIDVALSATFGTLLILLLWVSGRLYLMPTILGFTSEMLPGANAFVPGWSLLVHRCISLKNKEVREEEKVSGSSISRAGGRIAQIAGAAGIGTTLSGNQFLKNTAGSEATKKETPQGRIPLKTFDGIRPANDNRPPSYVQAA